MALRTDENTSIALGDYIYYSFNSSNITGWTTYNYGQEMQEEFLNNIHRLTAFFFTVLAVWTFIINLIVILACTRNKLSKYDMFYSQVVNFSVSSIFISVFVLPLTVYHMLSGGWRLGEWMCTMYVVCDVLLPFVSIVILTFVSIDKLMASTNSGLYSCLVRNVSKSVLLLLPWLVASVIVIPIWTIGRIPYYIDPNHCLVILTPTAGILCPVLTYFVPLAVVASLSFKIILQWLQLEDDGVAVNTIVSERPSTRHSTISPLSSDYNRNDPTLQRQGTTASIFSSTNSTQTRTGDMIALCVMNLAFTLMWFPFQCVSLTLPLCQSEMCVPGVTLNQVITLFGTSSAGLAPLCWFVDKQLRANVSSMCSNMCYQRLEEKKEEIPSELSGAEETFV